MASTSLTLGPHWEEFVRSEVQSGRYGTASEVVRAGLRELEERRARFEALKAHVAEGAAQADRGDFADDATPARILSAAQARVDRDKA